MNEQEFVEGVSGGLLQSMDIVKYCNDIKANGIELSSVYVDLLTSSLLELPGSIKRQRLGNAMNVIEGHFGKESIKPQSNPTDKPQPGTTDKPTPKNAQESHRNDPQRAKGGRPTNISFETLIMQQNKEKVLKRLHDLVDGHKGRRVALVMRVCVKLGIISHPTWTPIEHEFKNIGKSKGFYKYFNGGYTFQSDEVTGMIRQLADLTK